MKKSAKQVDLKRRTVRIGERMYHYQEEDYSGRRTWHLKSRKWVHDDEGRRYQVEDLEEHGVIVDHEDGLSPVEIPVSKAGRLKLLNRLVDEAEEQLSDEESVVDPAPRKARRSANIAPIGDDEDDREEETQEAKEAEGAEEVNQEKSLPIKTGSKSRTAVSIRFQDVDSGHAFDFYLSRSKKNSALFFAAIYQGRKPLRYANVRPQTILDFKEKVAAFSVTG